jgi:hypothetical protein
MFDFDDDNPKYENLCARAYELRRRQREREQREKERAAEKQQRNPDNVDYSAMIRHQLSAAYRLLETSPSKKDEFISENKDTVSVTEASKADNKGKCVKIFNFASQEVTILQNNGEDIRIVPFDKFPDGPQLETAAQKLKEFGGNVTGSWKTIKPGALAKQPRLK